MFYLLFAFILILLIKFLLTEKFLQGVLKRKLCSAKSFDEIYSPQIEQSDWTVRRYMYHGIRYQKAVSIPYLKNLLI